MNSSQFLFLRLQRDDSHALEVGEHDGQMERPQMYRICCCSCCQRPGQARLFWSAVTSLTSSPLCIFCFIMWWNIQNYLLLFFQWTLRQDALIKLELLDFKILKWFGEKYWFKEEKLGKEKDQIWNVPVKCIDSASSILSYEQDTDPRSKLGFGWEHFAV